MYIITRKKKKDELLDIKFWLKLINNNLDLLTKIMK